MSVQSVLIETHAEHAQAVLQYLTLYKLRSKVKIIAQQGEYKVCSELFMPFYSAVDNCNLSGVVSTIT